MSYDDFPTSLVSDDPAAYQELLRALAGERPDDLATIACSADLARTEAPRQVLAAPHLESGGSIVSIASRAALGTFWQANYVAAKSALVGANRAMAVRRPIGVGRRGRVPGVQEVLVRHATDGRRLRRAKHRGLELCRGGET